jgi:hypothetical protein
MGNMYLLATLRDVWILWVFLTGEELSLEKDTKKEKLWKEYWTKKPKSKKKMKNENFFERKKSYTMLGFFVIFT